MALGGGAFIAQNKTLPGAYINFISAARATASLGDRGVVAAPFALDYGPEGRIFGLSASEIAGKSLALFGYAYTDEKMRFARELFANARTVYFYRLDGGTAAECTYAKAKYGGTRGNALTLVVEADADSPGQFVVQVLLNGSVVDRRSGAANTDDLKESPYLDWKPGVALEAMAGMAFTGGTDTPATGEAHTRFLDAVETCGVNVICCPADSAPDPVLQKLYAQRVKTLRDERGVKVQCVVWNYAADHEGVINVKNAVVGAAGGSAAFNPCDIVYWVAGVAAGTPVNRSALNKIYDGEYLLDVDYTQLELENAIKNGEFAFHHVGNASDGSPVVRVLADINSLITVTAEKGDDFKENQTIRVLDQIGNDIAALFANKYLGVVPNDHDGRVSLWADIVAHHRQLEAARAIEDFDSADVTVEQGNTRKSVVVSDKVRPVNAMAQLYMTVVVA